MAQRDFRCECCGRHVSELKPFGKITNRYVLALATWHGALAGKGAPRARLEDALLVKSYRGDPADNPADRDSWECVDCIVLPYDEFCKRQGQYFRAKKQACEQQDQRDDDETSRPRYVIMAFGWHTYKIVQNEDSRQQKSRRLSDS
jgi:hypothetical protein